MARLVTEIPAVLVCVAAETLAYSHRRHCLAETSLENCTCRGLDRPVGKRPQVPQVALDVDA